MFPGRIRPAYPLRGQGTPSTQHRPGRGDRRGRNGYRLLDMQQASAVQPLQSVGRAGMDAGGSIRENGQAERAARYESGASGPGAGCSHYGPGAGGAETTGPVYRGGNHGGGHKRHVHGVCEVGNGAGREADRRGDTAGTAHRQPRPEQHRTGTGGRYLPQPRGGRAVCGPEAPEQRLRRFL